MSEFEPIENHAIVGDLHTVALVALNGTIDFMCFPRFNSPTIFASLLDPEKGGCFKICPKLNGSRHKQLYLPSSNILLTRFLSADGVAEICDFMPVADAGAPHNLVRRVKCVRGELDFTMRCEPRFDYGRAQHTCERQSCSVLFLSSSPDGLALRLRSSVPVEIENGAAVAHFRLGPDQSASFILEDAREELGCDAEGYVAESFKQTLNYWRNWIGRCAWCRCAAITKR